MVKVGPSGGGTFDERAMDRLTDMGRWMVVHGRAIYGCTQAPADFPTPPHCLLTYHPGRRRLYVHVLEWPMGGQQYANLSLDGFAGKVRYAQLLNDGSEIRFADLSASRMAREQGLDARTLTLQLPVQAPDVTIPVIELFLE